MGKVLVAVPNASLMDNHQAEVAKALSDEGYLLQSTPKYPSSASLTDSSTLSETLTKLKDEPELRPFPASGNKGFARILDKELGLA
jgi:beta-1,4-N-acetylglucosaminyltransferase